MSCLYLSSCSNMDDNSSWWADKSSLLIFSHRSNRGFRGCMAHMHLDLLRVVYGDNLQQMIRCLLIILHSMGVILLLLFVIDICRTDYTMVRDQFYWTATMFVELVVNFSQCLCCSQWNNYTLKRYFYARGLFMRIMRGHIWSHKLVSHYISLA